MKRSMKCLKRIILMSGISFFFVFFVTSCFGKANAQSVAVSTSQSAQSAVVKRIDYESSIQVRGLIKANDVQKIKLPGNQTVKEVFVKKHQRVKKGELLLKLDDSKTLYELKSMQSKMEKTLLTGTKKDIELMKLQEKSLLSAVESQLANSKISGIVTQLKVHEGDWTTAGQEAIVIMDTSKLKATINVDQMDIGVVNKGQECVLTFANIPEIPVYAIVTDIDCFATAGNDGRSYVGVGIELKNPPKEILPGFAFSAKLGIGVKQSLLVVSVDALKTKEGKTYVSRILSDGSTESVFVRTEYLGEGYARLLDDALKEGDTVEINIAMPMRYEDDMY